MKHKKRRRRRKKKKKKKNEKDERMRKRRKNNSSMGIDLISTVHETGLYTTGEKQKQNTNKQIND